MVDENLHRRAVPKPFPGVTAMPLPASGFERNATEPVVRSETSAISCTIDAKWPDVGPDSDDRHKDLSNYTCGH